MLVGIYVNYQYNHINTYEQKLLETLPHDSSLFSSPQVCPDSVDMIEFKYYSIISWPLILCGVFVILVGLFLKYLFLCLLLLCLSPLFLFLVFKHII